ncbi:MAG: ABC transporter permease [Gemmatimonadota bacterium]|nr:ABC transporter permease [Gemmatimonadota bacterium]
MSATTVPLARIVAAETKAECIKIARLPRFVIPTLAFPMLFYAMFGIALNRGGAAGPVSVSTYMLATYGTFGVLGAALSGLGIGIATERGQGWFTLKRASPMPPLAYVLAKTIMSMLFSAVIVLLLFAMGAALGNVHMSPASWITLFATLVLGAVPFAALGCALGFAVGPNSAPALINLVYLPMSFTAGLWLPIEMMPHFFRVIAPLLPPFHIARLALHAVGADSSEVLPHVLALVFFTALFTAFAAWAYRRDEDKTYG